MATTEERLNELEIKVSYQEDLVMELNAIVIRQQDKIDQLRIALETINERIRDLASGGPSQLAVAEKPPHY